MTIGSTDPFNLDYRVANLEKWRNTLESEGIAKSLAIMEERITVLRAARDADSLLIQQLLKESNMSGGAKLSTQKLITYGLGTIILVGGFVLQLLQATGVI